MALNKGKQFEAKFKQDFLNSFPKGTVSIDRLYDSVSGFKAISNISDFIGFIKPNIFYLECKSHKGASFPLSNLTQYDKLVGKVGIPGVRTGVILWLEDKDRVDYIPISTITKLKENDIKSINPEKLLAAGYRIISIPSVKKRVYMDSDYSILTTLEEGE